MADFGIGEPRRHHAAGDFVGDGIGFMRDAIVIFECDRSDAAGAMASLAMLLKDGKNVAIKSGRGRCGLLLRSGGSEGCDDGREDCREKCDCRKSARVHDRHYS